ncbi:MAG: phosphotransferase [Actinobacteria bacterium]|nr:phosphotransferase [Actinomycetota bacterium]
MRDNFFDQDVKIQTASLTLFAKEILVKYGIIAAEVECINFEFNATFAVTNETGQKYALRLNINSTRGMSNILAETQWVRELARIPSINVPVPIATLDDQYVASGIHADSGKMIFAVMYSWLSGEEIGDEPTLEQLRTVGQTMALLHENSSSFLLTDGATLPTFNDFFWGTEDYLFSTKSTLIPKDRQLIEQARDLIMRFTADLYASSPVHIIHADFHGWNLMWHEDQLFIFDFDDCGFGVEAQDIAVALYYLDTPEQDTALLDGYREIRPLPVYSDNAMKALLLQRRLLLLNYLYETKNSQHKEMLPAYLEKTLERVSTFLTDVTQ